MSEPRFQRNGINSFYGDFLYDQVVPQDHFLRRLAEVVPWHRFTYKLLKYYKGKGMVGRPPIAPALVLKMLLLAYLYNLSERQVETFCHENMPAKYFLGLAVDAKAPDHTTLSAFKQRILDNGKLAAYDRLLKEIIAIAMEAGVKFGSLQLVDSTHTVADVNIRKDERRQRKGKPPRDANARWGAKHTRIVGNQQGEKEKRTEYFHGYKTHTSFNLEAQMITSLDISPGNRHDGDFLSDLIKSDLAQGLPVGICVGDRAYDDTEIHFLLESLGIYNAIKLKKNRTQKKDPNKQVWLELKRQPWYEPSLKERYQIERKFAEAKKYHGLGRCRYVGILRYAIQAYMTAIALDLKRLVRLVAGVPFKGMPVTP